MTKQQLELFRTFDRPILENFEKFVEWTKTISPSEREVVIQGRIFSVLQKKDTLIFSTKIGEDTMAFSIKDNGKNWF